MNAFVVTALSIICLFLIRKQPIISDWIESIKKFPRESFLLFLLFFALFYLGGSHSSSDTIDYKRSLRILIYVYIVCSVWANLLIRHFAISKINLTSKIMFIYAIMAMLTALYSIDPSLTLWKGFEIFVHVSVAFALSIRIRKKEEIKYLLAILCFVLLFLNINLIIGTILFPQEALNSHIYTEYGLQKYSVLVGVFPKIHSNSSSQIGAMFALIAISYLIVNITGRKKQIALFFLISGTIVMLLGHARTSNIAFIIVLTFIVMAFGKFKNKFILILFILLMVTLIVIIHNFMDPVYNYLRRGQSQEQLFSLTGRTYLWKIAILNFFKKPWLGYGYYVAAKSIASKAIVDGSNLDNTYLNVLIGGGLTLAFPFILSVWNTLISLWQSRRKAISPTNRLICIQATSIFLIILIRSFSGPTFDGNHFNLIFFLICALAFSKIITHSDSIKQRQYN